MLKQCYKYITVSLLAGMIISCSPEVMDDAPLTEGDVPVELSGMLTRALGDSGDPGDGQLITTGYPLEAYSDIGFRFAARTTDDPPANYFLNQQITIGAKNGTHHGRNKLNGTVYYPLGQKAINLFAYTGGIAQENGDITLNAGTGHANDYLLGTGTEDDGTTPKSGTSDDPVEYITFRHLMTRVDVKIEVDGDVEPVKPVSMNMRFSRSGTNGAIVNRGTFNIFNGVDVDATSNANAEYTFSNITVEPTIHYLIPNGVNLTTYTGQIVSYLKINDYIATPEDLQALKFSQADKEGEKTDFILKPGLAYDLTFVINRLKITEIKLTLKDWDVRPGETEWDYKPKTMTLYTGSDYTVADDDSKITQMVLKYKYTDDKTYQYVGEGRWEGAENKIDFVTLPADFSAGTLTADLYTKDGLLVDGVEIESSGDGLNVLNLGKYGMKKSGDVLEISTPLQFALMVNDETKPEYQEYLITKTIDMENIGIPLEPEDFPIGSVLDGNGHDILNLNINGNGLFNENYGTLKNFRIVSGLIKGSESYEQIGAICRINYGTIEAVVNQADIQPATDQEYAGGIAGFNYSKIIASVNSGNILGGRFVGGIMSVNSAQEEGDVTACINLGMLPKDAELLGGIIGSSLPITSGAIVNTCFWLTGTARKNQAESKELAIGNNPDGAAANSADLAASSIRDEAIDKLNSALTDVGSQWEFIMDPVKSSWPIAKPNP